MTKQDKIKKPRNTVTLSLSKGYEDEINYFNEQPNKSKYVWELVREDMKRQDKDNQLLEMVKQTMNTLANSVVIPNAISIATNETKEVNNSDKEKLKKGAMSFLQD